MSDIISNIIDITNINIKFKNMLCSFDEIYEYLKLIIMEVINNTEDINKIDSQSKFNLIFICE